MVYLYQNEYFKNEKEIRKAFGLSGSKIRAKLRDGEIVKISNTGVFPYEELYSYPEYDQQTIR
nr:hypothetical protein [uncultured Draconibacterium sp.]